MSDVMKASPCVHAPDSNSNMSLCYTCAAKKRPTCSTQLSKEEWPCLPSITTNSPSAPACKTADNNCPNNTKVSVCGADQVPESSNPAVEEVQPALLPIYSTRSPPYLDAKLNSRCYPAEADSIFISDDPAIPGYVKMRDLNLQARRIEKNDVIRAKGQGWKQQARSHRHEAKYCEICSQYPSLDGELRLYHHTHYSSKNDRLHAKINDDGQYWCNHCIKHHYVKTGERVPLVISSSTLAGWRGHPDAFDQEGDAFHIDWDLIRGAKIRTAIHSFKAQYSRSDKPIDAFILLGLNDLLEGASVSRIWRSLQTLTDLIRSTAPDHWTGPSTAAIGTILMPPILCRFTNSISTHEHVPYRDRKRDILTLNRLIGEYNHSFPGAEYNISIAPARFHTYGIKFRKNKNIGRPRNQMELAVGHDYTLWRESDYSEQLHLCDMKRRQMGQAVITYFKELYGVSTK